MNRVEIRNWFLRQIQTMVNPPDRVDIDHAELDQLYFEAAVKMAARARPVHLRAETTITFTGATSYALPTDFLSFYDLEPITVDGNKLLKRTKAELDGLYPAWRDEDNDGNADPTHYYEAGVPTTGALDGRRTVGFYLNPSSGTATVPYCRQPRLLSALTSDTADYADLPTEFQRTPCYDGATEWLSLPSQRKKYGVTMADLEALTARFERETLRYVGLYGEQQQRDRQRTVPVVSGLWIE